MKRFASLMLVMVLVVAVAIPGAMAAEKKVTAPTKKAPQVEKQVAVKGKQVTQCELAQLLVQVLGLSRFLPPAPSCQQAFAVLLDNAISPAEGWNPDKTVVMGDLARVIVQAMKLQSEIENPDNPQEWVDYLKGLGVPLEAVGETVSYLEPLPEPIAPNVVAARVDPLVKRHKFDPIDETQYGVDMEAITRILSGLEFGSGEFRPEPLTPD